MALLGAIDLGAVMALGCVHVTPGYPMARFGNGMLFVHVSSLAGMECGAVWRSAYPAQAPAAGGIKPLIEVSRALALGLNWVGLGPGSGVPAMGGARFDGKYYVTGVSHSYTPESGGPERWHRKP